MFPRRLTPVAQQQRPLAFYLAGKVSLRGWRNDIVDAMEVMPDQGTVLDTEWPIQRGAIFGTHDYVGPFFMSGQHAGTWKDDSHASRANGMGDCYHGEPSSASYVHGLCLGAIAKADVIFAWADALGPLTEPWSR